MTPRQHNTAIAPLLVRFSHRIVIAVLIAGASACSSSTGPSAPGSALALTRLRSDPFSLTYASGLREPQRLVVRDATAWQQLWTSVWRGVLPEPSRPQVDFGREMVVLAAMGERPTGGFTILIDSASEGTSGISIRIRSISPGSGCGTTQALTQPVDIARMPRRDGSVTFDERLETQECR
jgi:hypothetical protein